MVLRNWSLKNLKMEHSPMLIIRKNVGLKYFKMLCGNSNKTKGVDYTYTAETRTY